MDEFIHKFVNHFTYLKCTDLKLKFCFLSLSDKITLDSFIPGQVNNYHFL